MRNRATVERPTLGNGLAEPRTRAAGRVCLAGAALVAGFWTLYLAGPLAPPPDAHLVRAFESAFPVADGVLALVLAGAGLALLGGRPAGPFLLTVGAAMSLYLGLLDATFYGLRGLNSPFTATGRLELGINLLCVGGGLWALGVAWRLFVGRRHPSEVRPIRTDSDGSPPPTPPHRTVRRAS